MIARDASNDRDTMSGERSGSRPERRHIAGHADRRSPANSRAVDSQLRVIEAVIQRTLFDNPGAVARVANICAGEIVLEPSAGTGLLAVFAQRAGATLVLNEIAPWRRAMLAAAYPDARIFGHDAELIDDLLPVNLVPDVVLINPPFSRSEGRGHDRIAGLRHLRAALTRLRHGGRCVAILPTRVDTGSADWKLATAGAGLVAQIELPANAYARHGTSQPVQVMLLRRGDFATPTRTTTCPSLELALAACDAMDVPAAAPLVPASRLVRSAPRASSLLGNSRRTPVRPMAARAIGVTASAEPVAFEILDESAPVGVPAGLYLPYRPSRIALAAAQGHPTALVESIAMGSIAAPKPACTPVLPPRLLDDRVLSDAQVETAVYAGGAFE
ncbi:strawberry notch family protein [Sphingobium sp. H39-3-25]|uniref:strawberry notch-like NTP hydrolase domain-containing protein n=1 Tax=Sphingobium arseniciresistens TaxID=3030834 RepID=UPI0023B9E800|nr:strawberry notch family protein [Sphingobium arseniciresistens]